MTLADGNKYKFRTLTRKQIGAVQKKQANSPHSEELRNLQAIEEEEGLTIEQSIRMAELNDLEEVNVFEMIRMSMAPAHPEYALTNNKKDEAKLNDKLQDLMDMRDMGIISNFAISGTLPVEEAQELSTADIDLG
jgi:hypothetical protein